MMKQLIYIFSIGMGLGILFLLTGCEPKMDEDNTLPWGKPASWEGYMPGIPSQDMTD